MSTCLATGYGHRSTSERIYSSILTGGDKRLSKYQLNLAIKRKSTYQKKKKKKKGKF